MHKLCTGIAIASYIHFPSGLVPRPRFRFYIEWVNNSIASFSPSVLLEKRRPGNEANVFHACMPHAIILLLFLHDCMCRINPTQPGDLKESYDMCERGMDVSVCMGAGKV